MSYSEMDYTKKISFAEEWLKRAKREFEQGSSVTAGSHIILAIAEMETLKRTIFPDSAPIQKTSSGRFHSLTALRPIFAIALLAIALGIFSYTLRGMNDAPVNEQAALETRLDSISGTLVAREDLFRSNNIIPGINEVEDTATPVESQDVAVVNNEPIPVVKPVTAIMPKAPSTGIKPKVKSVKPAVVEDKPLVMEENSNPPSWLFQARDESELLMEAIQLEAIIAARESLNEK
ncbi:hypothetical protein J7L05_12820 [bacterium]|nr:hypothetical protein [bacterium]